MNCFLDNAATTKIHEDTLDKIIEIEKVNFANSSSIHAMGVEAMKQVEKARMIIAKKMQLDSEKIFFTSGGTESNNWVLKSIAESCENIASKRNIIISAFEHPSVEEVSKWISEKYNLKLDYVSVNENGIVSVADLQSKITENTLYCSIMHANNEIGTIQPIDKISEICREKLVPFHVDACQSFLKIAFNFDMKKIDFITINAHKAHGPKGVGALVVNGKLKAPYAHGGGHELGMRSGTLNTSGIVGFGHAVKIVDQEKLIEISNYAYTEMQKLPGIHFNAKKELRVPHIINFRIENINAKDIFWFLNSKNIFVSTSSACASNKNTPSKTLKAIGLSEKQNFESVRVSLSCLTTKEEVDYFISCLKEYLG